MIKVEVEGVVPERREEAILEVKSLSESCFREASKSLNILITVASDFVAAVERFRRRGLKYRIPYEPKRTEVIAVAKTIPYLVDGKIHFGIILDGKAFGCWEKNQELTRQYLLAHEFIHVLDMLSLFEKIGAKAFFKEPGTVEELMFSLAHEIWMEYHANRLTLNVLETNIRRLKKAHSDLAVNYGPIPIYIDSFRCVLMDIIPFLKATIQDFRHWKLTIDDLLLAVYPRIRELLVLRAYTSAIFDTMAYFQNKIKTIEETETYQLFLSDIWAKIDEELKKLYLSEEHSDIHLSNISEQLKSLFCKFGLKLSNTSMGIYVKITPLDYKAL